MENIPSLSECFEILKEKKLHIAFAESCTGGLCAKALTDLAGASEVIEASVVSYSNRIKIEKLGVKAETIEKHTEVSAECEPGLAVRDYDGAFLQGGRHLLRLAGGGLQGHRSGDQAGQEGDSFHRCRVLTGYTGLQSLA